MSIAHTELPVYPDFAPIDVSLRCAIERLTAECPAHGDFQFTSMYAWGGGGGVSTLNGNLVLRQHNAHARRTFYSFCGTHRVADTAATLLDASRSEGIPTELRLIGEAEATALARQGFIVTPDRERFDYLLDIHRLSDLSGNALEGKRRAAKKFTLKHPHTYQDLDASDSKVQNALLSLRECPRVQIGSDSQDTAPQLWTNGVDADWQVLECLLASSQHFSLDALGLFVNNRLVAFSIAEQHSSGLSFVHFLKSDWRTYPGCTEAMLRETARRLHDNGSNLMNYGSDDGVPGIKMAKQLFRPVGFVCKYTVHAPGAIAG